jgi:hypothetical protein
MLIGYIFEARKIGDEYFLGVMRYGYPDINFIMRCGENIFNKALNQPNDDGQYFAVTA